MFKRWVRQKMPVLVWKKAAGGVWARGVVPQGGWKRREGGPDRRAGRGNRKRGRTKKKTGTGNEAIVSGEEG